MGLIRGHAYSITDVKLLDIETPRVRGKVPLLRIKNPWGNEAEWKGAWGDGSKEWGFIDDETKEEIGLVFDADGEFWMSFKDFMAHFDRIEICNLSPDSLEEEYGKKKWNMSIFEGAWVEGESAGGCRNYLGKLRFFENFYKLGLKLSFFLICAETFPNNPQYIIDILDPDPNDAEDKCTIIVALMQKNRRAQKKEGLDCLTIGFAIYRVGKEDFVLSLSS